MQDDICVGGLVFVLSNDDVSVVQIALEVLFNFSRIFVSKHTKVLSVHYTLVYKFVLWRDSKLVICFLQENTIY